MPGQPGARPGAERGSSAVELAVLAPALMLICMLILQFGLWFNARQAALAAAQAARWWPGSRRPPTRTGRARRRAPRRSYYDGLHTSLLGRLAARTPTETRGPTVFVTVQRPAGLFGVPFFGLDLTISATAGGPVECFRPARPEPGCG